MKSREIFLASLAALVIAGGIALFHYLSSLFLPVVIALLLAYLFNPLVTRLFGILGMVLAVPATAVLKVGLYSLLDYYRASTFSQGA
jgi:predicted PurR-regulated permease PerM